MPEPIQQLSNRTILANQFGPGCPQPYMDQLRTSEDCLLLNVWIPEVGYLKKTAYLYFLILFTCPFFFRLSISMFFKSLF